MNKNVRVTVLVAAAQGLLNAIFHFPTVVSSALEVRRHCSALISVFSPEISLDPREFYQIILFLIPLQIVVIATSSNMTDEIGRFGVFIFTRHPSRFDWYLCITSKLVLTSMIYPATYVLSSMLVFIPGLCRLVYPIEWWAFLLAYMVTISMFIANAVLLANLSVLALGKNIATMIVIGGMSATAAGAFVSVQAKSPLADWFVRVNPVANSVLDWHEYYGAQNPLACSPALTVQFSIGFFLVLFTAIWVLGFIYVRNRDIY